MKQTNPPGFLKRLKTFDSLRVPAFRLFFGAQAGSWLGFGMTMLANNLLFYRLTGSAFLMGVMTLASSIPTILLSLLGGTIADRMQKKYILFATRLGAAATALIIALTLSLGFLTKEHTGSYWVLIFCAFLNGIFNAFINPALVAIVPELVGKDHMMNGISLNNLGSSIFMLISPTLAGFLIDTSGFVIVFYIMAGLNVISAILMLLLPRSNTPVVARKRNTMGDMVEGLKYIRHETVFLVIFIILIFHMLGTTGYTQLSAVFTESILKVNATQLGLLSSVGSVASILSAFIFASLPGKKRGLLYILCNVIVSVAIMVFAYSRWYYLSLGMAFFGNIGMTMQMILTPTLVQTYAGESYRARIQGLMYMAQGIGSFGAFFAGALSEAIGIQWAVGGLAGVLLIVSLYVWIFTKQLRRLD